MTVDGAKHPTPLYILPGLMCDSRMFEDQVAGLGATVIDGFYGDADSITEMAHYALDRLPQRVALLGHSMGARVALEVWRLQPNRVARLALADTGIHPVRENEAVGRWALRDLGRERGAAALVDAWLPPMLGAAAQKNDALCNRLRDMAIDAGLARYERQIAALLSRPDAISVVSTITCPTAIIVGSEDRWAPVAQHEEIATAIPRARLDVLSGAGHMAPAEDPDGFNRLLSSWLAWLGSDHPGRGAEPDCCTNAGARRVDSRPS